MAYSLSRVGKWGQVHFLEALRAHTHQQRALGSDRFRAQVEALTHRSENLKPRGRPLAIGK